MLYVAHNRSTIQAIKGGLLIAQEERLTFTGIGCVGSSSARMSSSEASSRKSVLFPAPGAPRISNPPPASSKACTIEAGAGKEGSSDSSNSHETPWQNDRNPSAP